MSTFLELQEYTHRELQEYTHRILQEGIKKKIELNVDINAVADLKAVCLVEDLTPIPVNLSTRFNSVSNLKTECNIIVHGEDVTEVELDALFKASSTFKTIQSECIDYEIKLDAKFEDSSNLDTTHFVFSMQTAKITVNSTLKSTIQCSNPLSLEIKCVSGMKVEENLAIMQECGFNSKTKVEAVVYNLDFDKMLFIQRDLIVNKEFEMTLKLNGGS